MMEDSIDQIKPLIRFRLTQLDTISLSPDDCSTHALRTSPFLPAGRQLYKVPVIRIFGATPAGQRVLAHVHGAMSYFYVQYDGPIDPDTVHRFIRRLGHALNYATAASLGQVNSNKSGDRSRHQYVAYIAICKGVPFYGFHVGYRYFLKIYCLQARFKKRMADLLRSGKVIDPSSYSPFQTSNNQRASSARAGFKIFEEHIPFHLQFMLDHNLYGCGMIELSECSFRLPLPVDPAQSSNSDVRGLFSSSNVSNDLLGPPSLTKTSYCTLEIDCHVSAIMNRHIVQERSLHDDFHELVGNPIFGDEKLVHSVKELWEDERRRRQARGMTGPHEVSESGPSSQRIYGKGEQPEWAMEPDYRQQIKALVDQDLRKRAETRFESFVKPQSHLSNLIPTTFQAIEAIHISTWIRDETNENPFGVWAINGIGISRLDTEKGGRTGSPETIKMNGPSRGEEEEVCESIDVSILQSQMQDYKDDALDEDNNAAMNIELKEYEDVDLPDMDWDALEELDGPLEHEWDIEADADRATAQGRSESRGLNTTPRKTKGSIVSRNGTASPASRRMMTPRKSKSTHPGAAGISGTDLFSPSNSSAAAAIETPSKRQNTLIEHFSPQKLNVSKCDSNTKAPTTPTRGQALPIITNEMRKRTTREQDDGFAQPKEGKMMKFISRQGASPARVAQQASSKQTEKPPRPPYPEPIIDSNHPSPAPIPQNDKPPVDETLFEDLTFSDFALTPSTLPNSQPPSQPPQLPAHTTPISSSNDFLVDSARRARSSKRLSIILTTPIVLKKSTHSWYQYSITPPASKELVRTLVPAKVYKDPFYSDPNDVSSRKREYGGRLYTILGSTLRYLPEFTHQLDMSFMGAGGSVGGVGEKKARIARWEFAIGPPRISELREHQILEKSKRPENYLMISQIEGPTQMNEGYKYTPLKKKVENQDQESQQMDVLAVEVHAKNRGTLRPDPSQDPIEVVFYCLQSSRRLESGNGRRPGTYVGMIIVKGGKDDNQKVKYALNDCLVEVVETEIELMNLLIDKVRDWDPEVLTGFELESWSWGYVMGRGRELDFDVVHEFGRVKRESHGRFAGKDDKWGYTHGSSIRVSGRHVLSIWRIIRSEFAVTQYTFENLVFHILRKRLPHYSFATLGTWWRSGSIERQRRVLLYYLDRVELDLHLMDETEIISRNAEISRVLGVDFFSAISRGSQFKVESVLFRIAKPENYLLPSPSREEVGQQNAAECIPLIMEPQSAFYKSPLIVLDFQSLYPSIMIAYNYCYSTCLGRIGTFKGTSKFGTSALDLPDGLLGLLKDHLIVSPNGLMFVKPQVRKSLLSKMLSEFLDTRVMIKESMKAVKDDKGMCKMMNARQLGLKFIANVTYGYTSASFSGRMPCVEIADAIVQTGRETLEKSMEFIHSVKEWDAKVVYGDTDSLFVYLPGRTKEDAFRIGKEMAEAVTKRNPAPVKLKFEKVYLPCVLMAKKRYVGSKYESLADVEPHLEAKGIEVIRRDGIPALQKIQETCLKKLFRTQDLSDIKAYLYRQWQRLLLGKVSIQDFTFAKEVKLGTYSENVPPPPGALIAARKMASDPRTEPAYAERVPYVIVKGAPQSRLRDRAVPPEVVLENPMLALDSEYYITRVFIPSLARIFNLIGVDIASWYASMPKFVRIHKPIKAGPTEDAKEESDVVNEIAQVQAQAQARVGVMVDEHFRSDRCMNCEEEMIESGEVSRGILLCQACCEQPDGVAYALMVRARAREKKLRDIEGACRVCSNTPALESVDCDSLDCGRMYERIRASTAASVEAGTEVLETVKWLDGASKKKYTDTAKGKELEW